MQQNRKVRVSCMGDSITFGLMATSGEHSYPSNLQRMLGDNYCVSNFGRSGATVINDFEPIEDRYLPYTKTQECRAAMKSEPDIVVLMLGMNDANPTHHFNESNGGPLSEYYIGFYEKILTELIENIKNLSTSPKVYLVKTTQMLRSVEEGFEPDYVRNFTENLVILRTIQEKVAKAQNIDIIDTYDDMQDSSYYEDGCHLTDEGYKKLAESVFKGLNIK